MIKNYFLSKVKKYDEEMLRIVVYAVCEVKKKCMCWRSDVERAAFSYRLPNAGSMSAESMFLQRRLLMRRSSSGNAGKAGCLSAVIS